MPLPVLPGGPGATPAPPRYLTMAARAAINAQETGEVFLLLVTIQHDALNPSLRFVNNTVNITSRSQTYLAWPFEITLPEERDDQLSTVQLVIDNIDRVILEGLRLLTSPPTILVELILASTPDTLEAGPFNFTLRAIEYDALVIRGTLGHEDVLNEPFPRYEFTPALFPGLFP